MGIGGARYSVFITVGPVAILMSIQLSSQQIDSAILKIEDGLNKYLWIQSRVTASETFHQDLEFRRRYNHFYRVRRNAVWQDAFFGLMSLAKRERLQFGQVLQLLHQATGRYEASFASKLFATLNPAAPIIDSVVLRNLHLRLPYASDPDRAAQICELHNELSFMFAAFLITGPGKYLVKKFQCAFPNVPVTEEKMLDFVLWQTRG